MRPGLAAALRRRIANVEQILLPATPGRADLADLDERLATFDLVVVGTISAHLQPAQAALAGAVLAAGRPTVTVALRTPWDLLAYPAATIYHCGPNGLEACDYEETEHFRVTRDFLTRYPAMLRTLLEGTP